MFYTTISNISFWFCLAFIPFFSGRTNVAADSKPSSLTLVGFLAAELSVRLLRVNYDILKNEDAISREEEPNQARVLMSSEEELNQARVLMSNKEKV